MTDHQAHLSVSAEAPRQLDVEGIQVDVADALEQLGGPGLGQGLGQSVAPRLVFSLQGAELVDGIGPLLGPGAAATDDRNGRELADGLAGREAGPVSSLALGAARGHALLQHRHVTAPITPFMGPSKEGTRILHSVKPSTNMSKDMSAGNHPNPHERNGLTRI